MKKLLAVLFTGVMILTLAACSNTLDNTNDTTAEVLGSEESLATLSYLSSGFLDFESPMTVSDTNTTFLASSNGWTEFENELDNVNVYFDRLKAIIDNGVEEFGSVNEEISDNELYDYKLTFTVNEEVYVIYYSIDAATGDMSGIIALGEVEYTFEVIDNMKEYEYQEEEKEDNEGDTENQEANTNENSTEEDDELDTEDEEEGTETKMTLIAYNGDDYIRVVYKTEQEDDETSIKFDMKQYVAGVEKDVELKISMEEDEYKVTIKDGEDDYSFKQEMEDDEVTYKLQYRINGTVGMVTIKEVTDEDGNTTYSYHIVEAGQEKDIEKGEPHSKGFDDDEDETDEEESEVETQSFSL